MSAGRAVAILLDGMSIFHLRSHKNEPDHKLDLESFIHSELALFEEGEDTLFCFLCGRPVTRLSEGIERGKQTIFTA